MAPSGVWLECSASGDPEPPNSAKIPFPKEQVYIKSKDRRDYRDSGTPYCYTSLEHSVLCKYTTECHDDKRGVREMVPPTIVLSALRGPRFA